MHNIRGSKNLSEGKNNIQKESLCFRNTSSISIEDDPQDLYYEIAGLLPEKSLLPSTPINASIRHLDLLLSISPNPNPNPIIKIRKRSQPHYCKFNRSTNKGLDQTTPLQIWASIRSAQTKASQKIESEHYEEERYPIGRGKRRKWGRRNEIRYLAAARASFPNHFSPLRRFLETRNGGGKSRSLGLIYTPNQCTISNWNTVDASISIGRLWVTLHPSNFT